MAAAVMAGPAPRSSPARPARIDPAVTTAVPGEVGARYGDVLVPVREPPRRVSDQATRGPSSAEVMACGTWTKKLRFHGPMVRSMRTSLTRRLGSHVFPAVVRAGDIHALLLSHVVEQIERVALLGDRCWVRIVAVVVPGHVDPIAVAHRHHRINAEDEGTERYPLGAKESGVPARSARPCRVLGVRVEGGEEPDPTPAAVRQRPTPDGR